MRPILGTAVGWRLSGLLLMDARHAATNAIATTSRLAALVAVLGLVARTTGCHNHQVSTKDALTQQGDARDDVSRSGKTAVSRVVSWAIQVVLCFSVLFLLMTVLTPVRSELYDLPDTFALTLCLLAASVIIISTKFFVGSRSRRLFGWVVAVAVFNVLVVPAVVVSGARVSASYAMPHLLLAFWTSIVGLIVIVGVKLSLLESHKIPGALMGGGIGITGFVLLMTQIGVVANGYPARVPMHVLGDQSELPLTSDVKIAVRFDGGSLKNVYLENGMLTIHQPVYYHSVDYTVYPEPGAPSYSGHVEISQLTTYFDAIQCMFSFGLVRPTESQVSFARND
jgi:hypothetical protein